MTNKKSILGAQKRDNGTYRSAIVINGVRHHLGIFKTAEDAGAAYQKAKLNIKDFIKEQDPVKVKVLSIDPNGKISLSIRQLQAPPPRPVREERRPIVSRVVEVSFEDKISKFLKDSDEKISEVRRNTDSKRGGRGARRG